MACCHRCAASEQFDFRVALKDLQRFRRRGPDPSTRQILAAIQKRASRTNATLLDIGGGIGAIHHFMLEHGFERATHIDASEAYLSTARDEAKRLGHSDRVQFQLAAFPDEAFSVEDADVVTLDRVVCCDPDYERLLRAAASRARLFLVFSYPRARWVTRLFVALHNYTRRVIGRGFRSFVHPPAAMKAVLENAGMRQTWGGRTWTWAVDLFERTPATPQAEGYFSPPTHA